MKGIVNYFEEFGFYFEQGNYMNRFVFKKI